MLTAKERLHQILEGNKVDRPACICPGGMMNMVTAESMEKIQVCMPDAHTDARKMADLAKAVYDEGCFENYGVPFCMTVEAEEMGAEVDMGSMIYEPHVTKYNLNKISDFRELGPVDVTAGRAAVVIDAIRLLNEETSDVPIVGNLTGPISTATSIIEPVDFYKALRKNPEEAHAYMEFVTDQLITIGKAMVEAGADIIAISDPSGTGEIMGPRHFKNFTVEYLNKLIEGVRADGVGVIVHICGQMNGVYNEINLVEADALSFDSIVSMKDAKENLPDRVLMGNVSTYTLEFGEPEKVKALTKNCMKNGSDIISPACGLGMKSPLTNIKAMLEAVKEEV